jgi:putative adhesin
MMQRLMTIVVLAACAAVAAPAQAQVYPERIPSLARERDRSRSAWSQRNEREEQTDRITKTIKVGANGQIDLANIAGDISVIRGSGTDATIEVVKTARGRTTDDAREALQLVQVDIVERGGRVEVRTRYPDEADLRARNRRNINVSVAYTVSAPAGTRISANSISGNIRVKDIQGDLALESISGTIQISNSGRVATAKSISGNVEITGTEVEGGLEASTVSGTVAVRKVKARRLDLGSVSGPVLIEEVNCDRVNGHSVSGDIRFLGTLSPGGRYEMRSHSGEIRLGLSGDTGFELTANTFSGSVSAPDFRITIQGTAGGFRQRGLRGVYGDGSAVLDLTTFSGSIALVKR